MIWPRGHMGLEALTSLRCAILTSARKPTRVSLIYRTATEPTAKEWKAEMLERKSTGCADSALRYDARRRDEFRKQLARQKEEAERVQAQLQQQARMRRKSMAATRRKSRRKSEFAVDMDFDADAFAESAAAAPASN